MNLRAGQRGMFVLGITLFASALSLVFVYITVTRASDLSEIRARSKALLDAQDAIDHFAIELKRAYDLANPPPDSTLPSGQSYKILQPNILASVAIKKESSWLNETIGFYFPDSNQVCVTRSDARDSQFIFPGTTVRKVCITLPADFYGRIERNELILDLKKETSWVAYSQVNKWDIMAELLRATPALANNAIYEPDPESSTEGSLELSGVVGDTDPYFKYQYSDRNCADQSDVQFCIKIKICVRLSRACKESEYIRQAYVFINAPKTNLFR